MLNIDRDEVLKLARCGWSTANIAEFFDCVPETILRRVSHAELNAARHERGTKLMEVVYMRAMGGRVEKKLPDGATEVTYLKSSDRALGLALKYYKGLPPQVIEINPDPSRPSNVSHTVDPEQLKDVLRRLNDEY
jgi:hypothetical protein